MATMIDYYDTFSRIYKLFTLTSEEHGNFLILPVSEIEILSEETVMFTTVDGDTLQWSQNFRPSTGQDIALSEQELWWAWGSVYGEF